MLPILISVMGVCDEIKPCTNLSDDGRKAGMVAALVINIRLLIPLPVGKFDL